jgi:hypothetical protein
MVILSNFTINPLVTMKITISSLMVTNGDFTIVFLVFLIFVFGTNALKKHHL